jgi:LCP family protein required for cell wall assembly
MAESTGPAPVVTGGRHGQRPVARRWPRRVLIGANIVAAMALLASGLALAYIKYRYAQVTKISLPGLVHDGRDSAGAVPATQLGTGRAATTILLVGNNTRTGLDPSEAAHVGTAADVGGARSDVTMLLHLDPVRGATILSIPRDLFVPMPPHSLVGSAGKIDAALNDGPEQLVEAITNDLGIPINHYVSINFDGFQHVIDALGGINMNFPLSLRDSYSGLNIVNTGCQHLNGAAALAVVRARHLQWKAFGRWFDDPQSDLSRIRRDHEFLTVLAKTIRSKGLSNPFRANAVIGNLVNQVTIDNGLSVSTMLNLLRAYGGLNPDTTPELTLPVTLVPSADYHYEGGSYGSVVFPSQPADAQTIATFLNAAPTAGPPPAVQVVDRSGVGAGPRTAEALRRAGFNVTSERASYAPGFPSETVVRYRPGDLPAAQEVLGSLAGAALLFADAQTPPSTIVIDVGSVINVVSPGAGPSSAAGPSSGVGPSPSSASDVPTTSTTSSPSSVPTPGGVPVTPSAAPLDFFDPRGC